MEYHKTENDLNKLNNLFAEFEDLAEYINVSEFINICLTQNSKEQKL